MTDRRDLRPTRLAVGVDVGGTFTDAVAAGDDGHLVTAKVPTTPHDQSVGVLAAVDAVLARAAATGASVNRFVHGMTVGTNALLEGSGAAIALVTTAGFGDVIELRRQDRAHLYRLDAHHPPPIVPRERRLEVTERCGPGGVIVPLDAASVERAVDRVAELGVEAVAVALLFSFRFPDHERRIRERLNDRLPHVHVSISSDVVPEIREYERFSTTCIDAHLAPVVGRYLDRLGTASRAHGLPEPSIMQSSGGTIAPAVAARHAAFTVLSGPAAGVIGAAAVARQVGFDEVLTFDMGGTSCDVALIRGEPERTPATVINGHPLHLQMLDVHTVSAGGGSIAWADSGGALRVGPRSAGAVPGPACYGRGGVLPTVTDADLVLGRIAADAPQSGGLRLDREAAVAAVTALAATLDMDTEACAAGIVAVAVQEMARALRVVSVERGIDPRTMALLAFGGAGPLHACDVADALGMRTVVLPASAGVLAAFGLVVAKERRDVSVSVLRTLGPDLDLSADRAALEARLDRDVPAGRVWSAACRYVGQTHSVTVAWDPHAPLEDLRQRFDAEHRRRLGSADPELPVEVVTIRLAAVDDVAPVGVPAAAQSGTPPPAAGPATFAMDGATGWLAEGWRARVHPSGAIVCER